jgi:uncharacterized small protein (DUF1192 family)
MDTQFQDQAQQTSDEKLFVKFYMGTRKNEERSEEAGHPVFDDVPFIRIIVPGDKNTVIDTTVDEQYKRRFARLWTQFQANETQTQPGLPITEWPAITRAQAEELKYLNITTVEQLSTLPDVYGGKIMGFNDLKRKAETYLAQAKDSALAMKLDAVNKQQADRITALEAEIARLSAMFEAQNAGKVPHGNDNRSGTMPNRRG